MPIREESALLSEAFCWVLMSSANDVALHRKSDEISIGRKAKLTHDAVFVKSDGPLRNTQGVGGLSHGFSLCQELDHFSLTRCEGFGVDFAPGITKHLHNCDYRDCVDSEILSDVTDVC